MKPSNIKTEKAPLNMVGSSVFGRYPKISLEKTYNMIISDGWLVPYAGYKLISEILPAGQGRGLYSSPRFGHMVAVIDDGVYLVNSSLSVFRVATLDTFDGDVFIAENNGSQIAICDKFHIYIFNYVTNNFQKATLDFLPGYVAFQNTYFISVDLNTSTWRLSDNNNGLSWPVISKGFFQTKADTPVATIPVPGKGNLLFVMGNVVTEPWYDIGTQLFPYQKSTFANIDYGVLNSATIDFLETFVIWLGYNDKSGPVIMYSQGGDPQQISTDGINFEFARLKNPQNSYGFLFKQDGHLIYQFTFPDDNVSYIYDFNTKKFFNVTDNKMNYHVAKKLVLFGNKYYFLSFNDGNLYEMNSEYTTYDGREIPRIRNTKQFRLQDTSPFIGQNFTFPIEQGENDSLSRIDVAVSCDGGQQFSNFDEIPLNNFGKRPNMLLYSNLGYANEMMFQYRFWGKGRFVVGEGEFNYYQ